MSLRLRRRFAALTCRALQAALPAHMQSWGWAIRHEVAEIPDDSRALLFAVGAACGLAPPALLGRLLHSFAALAGSRGLSSGGTIIVAMHDKMVSRPRALGIACAIGAVALGLAYMGLAGAPGRYLGVNAGALIIGLVMLALAGRMMPDAGRWPGTATMTMAGLLLATGLFGESVEGAARWVKLGGVAVQPSLILVPVMIIAFARSRNALSTAGMIVAALALSIQPDRAMAAALTAGLTILAVMRRDRFVVLALAGSIAGFSATLVRADTLTAAPYVDQVLYSSFDVHPIAGAAVLGGSMLLLVPAMTGWARDAEYRHVYAVFGIVWLATIFAAALGNYPTPIVGYGGSAIIGYVLSLTILPKRAGSSLGVDVGPLDEGDAAMLDRHLRVGVAAIAA